MLTQPVDNDPGRRPPGVAPLGAPDVVIHSALPIAGSSVLDSIRDQLGLAEHQVSSHVNRNPAGINTDVAGFWAGVSPNPNVAAQRVALLDNIDLIGALRHREPLGDPFVIRIASSFLNAKAAAIAPPAGSLAITRVTVNLSAPNVVVTTAEGTYDASPVTVGWTLTYTETLGTSPNFAVTVSSSHNLSTDPGFAGPLASLLSQLGYPVSDPNHSVPAGGAATFLAASLWPFQAIGGGLAVQFSYTNAGVTADFITITSFAALRPTTPLGVQIVTQSVGGDAGTFKAIPSGFSGPVSFHWTVSSGAIANPNAQMVNIDFGRHPTQYFSETVSVTVTGQGNQSASRSETIRVAVNS